MTRPDLIHAPLMCAADWYRTFPAPVLVSVPTADQRLDLRRYTDTPSRFDQPALSDNLLCIHLGGPKRLHRWRDGRRSVHDVVPGALTILPALQANRWLTQGPVDFGVIAISAELLRRSAMEEFDREPDGCALQDLVGLRSTGIERLFQALLTSARRAGAAGRLYPESLLVVLTVALLRDHALPAGKGRGAASRILQKGGLAAARLRAVTDYMADHIAEDVGLADLTTLTGLSRAHFFRAFKQSTDLTPHRYLAVLRLEKARGLLDDTNSTVEDIAVATGLGPQSRLTHLFRQRFGMTPSAYRLARR